jgi:nucleotidyltransferase substrate binding protein (TIGR01987 family)
LIVHRDALIKRFEFCYDLIWKFYKLLLVKEYAIDVASPKKVFQEGYQQNIFTKEDIEVLFEIIDARNETTHVYDEMVAETISKKILMFTPFLEKLLKKIHL